MNTPNTPLTRLLAAIGAAGERISSIEASEGAAGNISVCTAEPLDLSGFFTEQEPLTLPEEVPDLVGFKIIVTGSGRRLRDVKRDPVANLAVIEVQDATSGILHTAPQRLFQKVTSEFNSHLSVHHDQVGRTGSRFHALIHAQPLHLTYLSHIPGYQSTHAMNQKLMRWQPETIVQLPEGIGVLPFMLPGSNPLMQATKVGLREHRIVLWSKHGVMARSDQSVTRAVDRIEYAETAARYEHLNLTAGGLGEGLTPAELRSVVEAFGIQTQLV